MEESLFKRIVTLLAPTKPSTLDFSHIAPSVKSIGYSVQVLNLYTFSKVMQPKFEEYYVTRKADGARAFLAIEGGDAVVLTDEASGSGAVIASGLPPVGSGDGLVVLEAEAVGDVYHVYDVLVLDGVQVATRPLRERMGLYEGVVERIGRECIVSKKHIHVATASSAELDQLELDVKQKKCAAYKIDGLIFTQDAPYYQASVWKWKSSKQTTLDVALVPDTRCPPEQHRFIACASVNSNILAKLPCSSVPQDILDIVKNAFTYEYESNSNTVHIPLWHPCAPNAFYVDFTEDAVEEELPPRSPTPVICEMEIYGWSPSGEPQWAIVRARTDKKRANNFQICWDCIWQVLHPLELSQVLRKGSVSAGYFQEDNAPSNAFDPMLKAMSDVKHKLFFSRVQGRKTCVDIGCGRGQDMFKYQKVRVERFIGVDNDVVALMQLTERYYVSLSTQPQPMDVRVMPANFVTMTDPNALANQIVAMAPPSGVDMVVSNFACHYFCGTEANIMNFAQCVKRILESNRSPRGSGMVLLTFPCGERIHRLLKRHNGEWVAPPYHDKAMYDVAACSDDEFPIGARYATKLPFTGEALYEEPLVPTKRLQHIFSQLGFKIMLLQGLDEISGSTLSEEHLTHLQKYVVLIMEAPNAVQRHNSNSGGRGGQGGRGGGYRQSGGGSVQNNWKFQHPK
eukprot:PhF_6_TR10062/c0_g1_i3/m.15572